MSIALIEKGERHKEISQRQVEYFNGNGVKCDWYYYPNEIRDWEFWKEVRDLEDFYDFVYIQDDSPQVCRNGLQQQLPNWVLKEFHELKSWNVMVYGDARYSREYMRCLMGRCKTAIWESCSVWPWADQMDLIICSTGKESSLNCYPLNCKIIDTSIEENECYNKEVLGRNFLNEVIVKNLKGELI